MLQSLHQKTRYNIRLSARKGVTVRVGTKEDLPEFYKTMKETGSRDNFIIRSIEYYEKIYDCLGPEHVRIMLAEYEGEVIAATMPILYGNKVWYLYGGSKNEKILSELPGYGENSSRQGVDKYIDRDDEILVKQVDFKLFKLFHHASSLPKILLLYHYCFCLSVKNREKVPQYFSPVPSCHSIF